MSRKYSFIYATVGISPNDIPQSEEELWKDIRKIENLILEELKLENTDINKRKKLVAIGEIGLDYYWEKDEKNERVAKKGIYKAN